MSEGGKKASGTSDALGGGVGMDFAPASFCQASPSLKIDHKGELGLRTAPAGAFNPKMYAKVGSVTLEIKIAYNHGGAFEDAVQLICARCFLAPTNVDTRNGGRVVLEAEVTAIKTDVKRSE